MELLWCDTAQFGVLLHRFPGQEILSGEAKGDLEIRGIDCRVGLTVVVPGAFDRCTKVRRVIRPVDDPQRAPVQVDGGDYIFEAALPPDIFTLACKEGQPDREQSEEEQVGVKRELGIAGEVRLIAGERIGVEKVVNQGHIRDHFVKFE